MRFLIAWALLIFFVGYGLLPVSLRLLIDEVSKPNTLLIERQVCGCPCAEGVIIKGQLQFSESIKSKYPNLTENENEITLTEFPPFDNLTNYNAMTFDFANNNTFKVSGHVIGVDTILCDPTNCEIVPKFQVSDWTTTTYYPRFWLFDKFIFIAYTSSILLGLPTLTLLTIIKLIRQKRKKKTDL